MEDNLVYPQASCINLVYLKALPDLAAWTLHSLVNPLVYTLTYQVPKAYPTHIFIERKIFFFDVANVQKIL